MMKNKICCICGKEFKGYGNNPYGVLKDNKLVKWKEEDRCCDVCNFDVVLKGRIEMLNRKISY